MGVDYSANYGFGVKVIINEEEDFLGWLDETFKDINCIYYFEVGSENYRGDENDIYVCIEVEDEIDKNNGYNFLNDKAEELINILNEKGIQFKGVPNIVGGLNMVIKKGA